jgi:NAD(P)-dependent dehydrogenase (short-subunit alcohol dehydrogenase family)
MKQLGGKVAVVTGAASGIGMALATRFAAEGMRVVLADVEDAPLAALDAELRGQGAEVLAQRTDVQDGAAVAALAARGIERFGAVHVVCNNAGVGAGAGPVWTATEADWAWTLGVNLWGVVHGIRAFVPKMIAQGEGHVVNTSSMAGLVGAPAMGPYCAAKHAVVGISECLHHDLAMTSATGVKVSVVCPAWVKTNIADSHRNRPASSPRRDAKDLKPQEQMLEQVVRAAVASGISPDEVAEQVLQAVLHERFWVLTHPMTKKAVENRTRGIVEGTNPRFDPTSM